MSNKFEIIELEEALIIKGFGSKEEALVACNKHESKEWGLRKSELSSAEDLKPIYELVKRERYCEDVYYSWKDKPFSDEKYQDYIYKTPVGYVVYY